jgi:hypothetical protein
MVFNAKKYFESGGKEGGSDPVGDFKKKITSSSSSSSTPTTTSTTPEVIRDAETGRISGVTIRGKSYLGLSEAEVNNIIGKQGPQPTPAGAVEASGVASTRRAIEEGVNLSEEIGKLNPEIVGSAEASQIDFGQAALAGLSAGAAAGTTTAAGLGIGAAAGGPVTLAVGAGITASAAVAGLISGTYLNIKDQQKGNVIVNKQALPDSVTNLRNLITLAKADPVNRFEYARAFNEQLSYIQRDRGILILDTSGFLKGFEDGTPALADYERFYEPSGMEEQLKLEMQLALITVVS